MIDLYYMFKPVIIMLIIPAIILYFTFVYSCKYGLFKTFKMPKSEPFELPTITRKNGNWVVSEGEKGGYSDYSEGISSDDESCYSE